MNLSKTCDTADRRVLITKLEYYGIRDITNNWFASYLTSWKQSVNLNDHESKSQVICIGVP